MEPLVGVYLYTDISFQIIDTPSMQVGAARGVGLGPQILGLARNADGIIIVLDLSTDAVQQLEVIRRELEEFGIQIVPSEAQIEFSGVSDDSQLKVSGKLLNCTEEDVKRLLNSYGIRAGLIKIGGGATLEQIEDAILRNTVYRPTVIVANKLDVKNSSLNLESLLTILKGELEILSFSCFQDGSLNQLGESLVSVLNIVRVYTKNPNSSTPSSIPITVKKGTKVVQVARMIHSRLSRDFKYARIWGRSAKYDGQRVGENHTLLDGDILEIHCK
jgi:ribosome-interacting GTPase 1